MVSEPERLRLRTKARRIYGSVFVLECTQGAPTYGLVAFVAEAGAGSGFCGRVRAEPAVITRWLTGTSRGFADPCSAPPSGPVIRWNVSVMYHRPMTPEEVAELARLRRARDLVDREYANDIDVAAMARVALMSTAHFSRKFRAAFGETPYSYIMTRRIERAKALLRQGRSVTDACMSVGCSSLGSFSSRFAEIVGEPPSQYRDRDHRSLEALPSCVRMLTTRPRRASVTLCR